MNVVLSGLEVWEQVLVINVVNQGTSCWFENLRIYWSYNSDDPTCADYRSAAWANNFSANDTHAEIHFNQGCPNFTWYIGNNPIVYGYIDAESVAMHELAHPLGLSHGSLQPRLRNLGVDCVWSRQVLYGSLSDDDAHVRAIYPSLAITGVWPLNITCIE